MADQIQILAHAKINVFLRVLRRREDGHHDIESLVVPVSLADEVTVRPDPHGGAFHMRSPAGETVPIRADENLAFRAAGEWTEAHWTAGEGTDVTVIKRIPIAAGLGGGSADAAAVLRAARTLMGRPPDEEGLFEIAARLGSDVPALLHGAPVVVRGRGEVLEPVTVSQAWWVLVPQHFPVSTRDAYGWWDEDGVTGPDPSDALAAASEGRVEELGGLLFNDLEGPVVKRHPEIGEARETLVETRALGAVMSGSGPTVVGLARDENHAREIAARVPGAIPVSAPP